MRRLAYIPARGGSKGIPKKNLREIRGLPLVAYSIRAARESGLFDRVFVSTDSQEIADVAARHGAWVPFLRNVAVAGDTASTVDAMVSDLERMAASDERFDSVCLLQPTSPLRTGADIVAAMRLFDGTGRDVVSVSPVDEHPYLMRSIAEDGTLKKVLPLSGAIRRQDLEPYYKINGAIYINAIEGIVPGACLADNPVGYVMPSERAIDIDTFEDLETVKRILEET